jgi:hypothetical protein
MRTSTPVSAGAFRALDAEALERVVVVMRDVQPFSDWLRRHVM